MPSELKIEEDRRRLAEENAERHTLKRKAADEASQAPEAALSRPDPCRGLCATSATTSTIDTFHRCPVDPAILGDVGLNLEKGRLARRRVEPVAYAARKRKVDAAAEVAVDGFNGYGRRDGTDSDQDYDSDE
jgi:hypothetical protein